MYKFHTGEWLWYFNAPAADISTPEELMRDAVVIKNNPEVKVFKKDGRFFKWEIPTDQNFIKQLRYRLFPRGKNEFAVLSSVAGAGFPVTEPVGFGCNGIQSVLVTVELSGFQPVSGFLSDLYEKGEEIPADFLYDWGEFIGRFIESGFYFPDFHCGNLMYNSREKRFALVDLYGVRKVYFQRQKRQKRMYFRHLKDAMPFLNSRQLFLVLQSAGWMKNGGDPDGFLQYAAVSVREFLPRRLKSLQGKNISLRPDGKAWDFAACDQYRLTPEEAEKVWKNALLCQLFGIPHLHLTRLGNDGILTGEKMFRENKAVDNEELTNRLIAAGLPAGEFAVVSRENQTAAVVDRRLLDCC